MPPPPVLTPAIEESAEQIQLIADIQKYVDSSIVQFIVGAMSPKEDWDTYLETLEKLNVERYMDVIKGQYERWLNR